MSTWAVRELRRAPGRRGGDRPRPRSRSGLRSASRANRCRRDGRRSRSRRSVAAGLATAARLASHPDCLLLEGAAVRALPGFAQGWFAVQDQASAFVVAALGPAAGGAGARRCAPVPAGRLAPRRVRGRLRRAWLVAARRRAAASALVGRDRRAAATARARCSRRTPGAGRRRGPLRSRARRCPVLGDRVGAPPAGAAVASDAATDLSQLARLQVAIAGAARGSAPPGRPLVYSVCTFPRAETDAACDALVRRDPESGAASRSKARTGPRPGCGCGPTGTARDGMFARRVPQG